MSLQAIPFLAPIDMQQSELRNAVIQVLSSAPGSPIQGQVYYDSTLKRLQWYSGTAWIDPTARANHSGTQLSSTISDLATTVQAYTLDLFAAAAGNVNLNSHKLINVTDPTSAQDAATKNYVDTQISTNLQGLQQKPSVRAVTTAALAANTYANGTSGVGATLTANSNAAIAAVDGVTLVANDLLLVKNEATTSHNGLYVVTQVGTGSLPYILTRHIDMDTSGEFVGAFTVSESEGTTNKNSIWLQTTVGTITVGTTSIVFTQLAGATSYSAGNGITLTGTTFSVKNGTGLTFSGSQLIVDTSVVPQKYNTTFGDGSSTTFTITHNLGTKAVQVQIYLTASPFNTVIFDVQRTTTNTITINCTTAPASGAYTVVVIG